jgi:diguanylate cyclase (GGDEF)-like protein
MLVQSSSRGNHALTLLLVEDDRDDAAVALAQIRKAGIRGNVRVALSAFELRAHLQSARPDVAVCEISRRGFGCADAGAIIREFYDDVPLIRISAAGSNTQAADPPQDEIFDVVLKAEMHRLPAAVQRAVGFMRGQNLLRRAARDADERLRRHIERLETLWHLIAVTSLSGDDLIHAVLALAVTAIRPAHAFGGVLCRVSDGVVEVIGIGVGAPDADLLAAIPQVGTRAPIDEFVPSSSRDRTGFSDDVQLLADIPRVIDALGWRAVIWTTFSVGEQRYAISLFSLQANADAFAHEDIAYIEILSSYFARQLQVERLEHVVRNSEERAQYHARRLERTVAFINQTDLAGLELWNALLADGARSIFPEQASRAAIHRFDGTTFVLEASVDLDGDGSIMQVSPEDAAGGNIPAEGSVLAQVLTRGVRSRAWNDLTHIAETVPRAIARGWRAALVTKLNVGIDTWTLSFVAEEPARRALGSDETTYAELLASIFAHEAQELWQSERLRFHTSHDALTGLFNRAHFRSQVHAISVDSPHYAILKIDIDAFREVNEAYGYMVGDALLVEVAAALDRPGIAGKFVGRLGGDIFGVCLPGIASREAAEEQARAVLAIFNDPFPIGDREGRETVRLTASVGFAVSPDDGGTSERIISRAQCALLTGKRTGYGSSVSYAPGMEGDSSWNATMRNEIASAVSADQFILYFQPHVRLNDGAVTGCEALIRWNHPTRGMVMPNDFIPFAERSGVITSIDLWVMQNALAAAALLRVGRPDFRTYFNLSGRQVSDPSLIDSFTAAALAGAPLDNIGVEITEGDAMRDVERTRRVCDALRALGVCIAIDDFGTGYSSLSSLKQLPLDVVKIDHSFTTGVLSDGHDVAIAESIIEICKRFGFVSLAEGAETPEHLTWLRANGCDTVQGFAVARPMPFDAFVAWLDAQTSTVRV